MHTLSPNKPKKFKQTFKKQKITATVFWDKKGVLFEEFMTTVTTINFAVYCKTLKNFWRAIQNKRKGLLTSRIVLIHDNPCPHSAAATQQMIQTFQWDIFVPT